MGNLGLSEKELGQSHADVLSERLPLLGSVVGNSVLDVVVNLDSVDEEVLAGVVGEASWAVDD